jgi:predicted RNase H-like HicB family nuclease
MLHFPDPFHCWSHADSVAEHPLVEALIFTGATYEEAFAAWDRSELAAA